VYVDWMLALGRIDDQVAAERAAKQQQAPATPAGVQR
jgi:hypothetical protein